MPRLVFRLELACGLEELWAFHSSVETLKKLTPPEKRVEILSVDPKVEAGAVHRLRVRQFGIPYVWESLIETAEPPRRFVDVATRAPFKLWRHEHRFDPLPNGGSALTDVVDYEPPFGPLGVLADRLFIRRDLERMFAYRHRVTAAQLGSRDSA